ncbi:neuroligin-4, X-linked, partial [Elysia marginata]
MTTSTLTKTLRLLFVCTFLSLGASKRYVQRRTRNGPVRGIVQHVHSAGRVERFMGIPYAKPPIGNLRFEAPEPASPWRGVKDALELSPACPQPIDGVTYIQGHVPDFNRTSEDCLYLNVYAPRTSQQQRRARGDNQRKRKAVLVFVHGGSYLHGMGAMLEGSHLAAKDIIVVTFNYRLGALGFLEADDEVFPGNYGLRDQLLALRWIQDNIAYFGGDPTRVTLDGHSAGGCTVGLLALLPAAQGLFSRVIQQSGSPFAHWAITRRPSSPNLIFKLFTASLGCYGNGTAEVKACLKNISSEQMEQVIFRSPSASVLQNTIFSSLVPSFRPVVDGVVIPDTPERLALIGRSGVTEFLTGTTTDEGLGAASTILERYYNKVDNFYSQDRPDPLLLVDLLGGSRAHLPNINSLLERLLDQYYVWPYDVSENQSKDGLVEIVGDFFISAPTHKSAEIMRERNATVYFYNYDYISRYDGWAGVIHGSELFYLSGYPFSGMRRHDKAGRTMASRLIQLWSSFAKNG